MFARYASVDDVPLRFAIDRPVMVAPVKLTLEVTVKLPTSAMVPVAVFQIIPLLKVFRPDHVLSVTNDTPPPQPLHVVTFKVVMVEEDIVVVVNVVVALKVLRPLKV